MMGVPKVYREAAEQVIASYAFTDLASGTGNVIYYLCQTEDSVGAGYILTPQVLFGADNDGSAGSSVKFLDGTTNIDFDLTQFKLPQTIEGTATINAGWGLETGAAGGDILDMTFTLKRVSGGVETTIGTVASPTETVATTNTSAIGVWLMKFAVTKTNFRKGDILRLNVAWVEQGNGVGFLGTDPADRDYAIPHTSTMTFTMTNIIIPYDIDA